MEIIYLHQYFKFPDEKGGTRSYDLACSFLNKGLDVTVVSSTSNKLFKTSKRWTVTERDGLKVHYIYLPYSNDFSYLKRNIIFLKFLWFSTFRVISLKSDVILATSTPLTIGIPALIKKYINKTPFIFEVRDVWPEAVIAIGAVKNKLVQRLLFKLEKWVYSCASAIVPLSVDMQRSIVVRYPQFREKTTVVVENISELQRFASSNIPTKDLNAVVPFNPRFTILYAGTFGRVNGISYVIDLAKRTLLIDSSIVYILIGRGAEKEKIRAFATESEVLGKNVFMLDPISKDELPSWYSAVNMGSSFVINVEQLWANSANKFFDTLAASKPILINHEGWQARRIRAHNIGYVLPATLTEQAVAEFVTYTKDATLQDEQSRNAFKQAKKYYSLEVANEKYMKVIRRVTSTH